jgi:glycolate oxidase
MSQVRQLSAQYNIPIIAFGHAGDGNVHLHLLCRDMDEQEWRNKLPGLMKDIYKAAVSYGGAISGEHGIGFAKKAYLPLQMSQAQLNVLKSVKLAFDPNNILNPGKIFDL